MIPIDSPLKMQLAYGKFDTDLNPPPFSEWSKAFTAVEIDLFQYFTWKPKVAAYFNSWVNKKSIQIIPRIGTRKERSAEEYLEAISLWKEAHCEKTIFFQLNSGRTAWAPELYLKELRKLPQNEFYFFEWGKNDTTKGVEFLKALSCFQGWVIDPDWHYSSFPELEHVALHFKLHGWSEERWIRRYGEKQTERILRCLRNRERSVLTLSYSGRVVEAPLFSLVSKKSNSELTQPDEAL